mmetsp:Transcript_49395/g.127471  ORF Transcript_49395/g.127471 Transcript_49395/m.127471 type:complete len:274 (-) Transcript_49395:109-930(-)
MGAAGQAREPGFTDPDFVVAPDGGDEARGPEPSPNSAVARANGVSEATACTLRSLEMGCPEAAVQPLTAREEMCIEEAVTTQASMPWRRIVLKIVVSVSVFVGLTLLLEKFAEAKVSVVSKGIMERIGLPGLFLAVLLADGVPQPFTYVPLIFMAVKGDVAKSVVFTICAVASYCAALIGYGIGFYLRGHRCGIALFSRLREEHPYVPGIMQRKGAVGVFLAALLPMPLAIATWTAGSFRVDFRYFLVAAVGRIPKIALFLLLSSAPKSAKVA